MTDLKVLYGICGIGMGHAFRQLPIVDRLVRGKATIVMFAYGESYRFYAKRFAGNRRVRVEEVAVPFYAGDAQGIDFGETRRRLEHLPHAAINCEAMSVAQRVLGKPDVVISDYEPVCAQFAYATSSPLVTIDQQSKYLVGSFPEQLNGTTFGDEVARLRMFFPRADARIACSFFAVNPGTVQREAVQLVPPIIRADVLNMHRRPAVRKRSVLVYLSSQRDFVQSLAEVVSVCQSQRAVRFHIFARGVDDAIGSSLGTSNVMLYRHGDRRFQPLLARCNALITTGGHSLLSEAMNLGIPSYVIPLAVYEQQMNAHVIDEAGFGVARARLDPDELSRFLLRLPEFAANIAADDRVLLRGSGESQIAATLQAVCAR